MGRQLHSQSVAPFVPRKCLPDRAFPGAVLPPRGTTVASYREKERERDGEKKEREGEEVGRKVQRQGFRVRTGTEIITKVRI